VTIKPFDTYNDVYVKTSCGPETDACNEFTSERQCSTWDKAVKLGCTWNEETTTCFQNVDLSSDVDYPIIDEEDPCLEFVSERKCTTWKKAVDLGCAWKDEISTCLTAVDPCNEFVSKRKCTTWDRAVKLGCAWQEKTTTCFTDPEKAEVEVETPKDFAHIMDPCNEFVSERKCSTWRKAEKLGCQWDTESSKCVTPTDAPAFAKGDRNVDACPSGYEKLDSSSQCREACKALGWATDAHGDRSTQPFYPFGCIENGLYCYWNNSPPGKANASRSTVCRLAEVSTDSPTGTPTGSPTASPTVRPTEEAIYPELCDIEDIASAMSLEFTYRPEDSNKIEICIKTIGHWMATINDAGVLVGQPDHELVCSCLEAFTEDWAAQHLYCYLGEGYAWNGAMGVDVHQLCTNGANIPTETEIKITSGDDTVAPQIRRRSALRGMLKHEEMRRMEREELRRIDTESA
jgi:hypothetical protein